MKKYFAPLLVVALVACGGQEDGANGSDETSSVVANTNPTESATEFEQVVSDPNAPKETTTIEYVETNHSFGDVQYPSENLYTFKFKNTGSIPLVIEDAKASCGCTVPATPEDPIMPGEMGELDVIFRPKEGQQGQNVTKRVTVTANTEPRQTYLEIKANVLPPMGE